MKLKLNLLIFFLQNLSSLAYVLADAGYDVWMPNNRGNFYSRENLFMDPNDPASGFWNFSWDDIAFEGVQQFFQFIWKFVFLPH